MIMIDILASRVPEINPGTITNTIVPLQMVPSPGMEDRTGECRIVQFWGRECVVRDTMVSVNPTRLGDLGLFTGVPTKGS